MSKLKLHFAERVKFRTLPMAKSESGAANEKKLELQTLINKHKISIDRKAFVKTQDEKDELKLAKSKWKNMMALHALSK